MKLAFWTSTSALAVAVIIALLFAASPVRAQAPPVITIEPVMCQFLLADTVASLEAGGTTKFKVLDPEARAMFILALEASVKKPLAGITGVLIAELDDVLYFGLEVNGCLLAPEPLAKYLPIDQFKLSGLTPVGVFA